MSKYWFAWNGVRSDERDIVLNEATKIIKPEERIEHVTIPGRSGEVTLTEGDDIYQSYIQALSIAVHGASNIRTVENWLKGAGVLTMSSQSGLQQNARVIGAVELQKHSRNLDWWEGDVQFYCEPVKSVVNEQPVSVTVSGAAIENPGDMIAFPRIEITGSGAVTVRIGSRGLVIPECVSGWVIDSMNEWILQGSVPQGNVCSGDFPVLEKGTNYITFTGNITQLLVTPNIRYL